MRCRGCERQAIFLDGLELGNHAIVNFKDNPQEKDDYSSLDLVKCPHCGLVQLLQSVPPDRLYSTFHYLSGINQSMNDALFDVVKDVEKYVTFKDGDVALDIGANDGTLLSYYREYITKIGFDPAKNIINKFDFNIVQDYFSAKAYGLKTKKPKAITAIAMFYDLEDPNQFLKDVYEILSNDGIFCLQMNDLDSMIQNISVDNICHEHLCYYNKDTLLPLLRKNNLHPISVSYNNVNGGSIRVICNKNKESDIDDCIGPEPWKFSLETMWNRFEKEKNRLLRYIDSEKKKGHKIYGYGASTRGNTLLQLLGLTHKEIEGIADRNPKKWTKYTAGTNIQIVGENFMRVENPENLLVLPYYFEKEFLSREIEYLKKGGKMIFPLPKFRIYTADKKGNLTVHGI